MGHDLRRLMRKGLVTRLHGQHRYVLTPYGWRVALFLTKVHARVLGPGLQALDLTITAQAPHPCAAPSPPLTRPSSVTSRRRMSQPDQFLVSYTIYPCKHG
jgi:hypothetical protein